MATIMYSSAGSRACWDHNVVPELQEDFKGD